MAKHKLLYSQEVYNSEDRLPKKTFCCENCGCTFTKKTWDELPCPPWEPLARGDTPQPGSHVGAGEVKDLKEILSLLAHGSGLVDSRNREIMTLVGSQKFRRLPKTRRELSDHTGDILTATAMLEGASKHLKQLIAKLEGQGGGSVPVPSLEGSTE